MLGSPTPRIEIWPTPTRIPPPPPPMDIRKPAITHQTKASRRCVTVRLRQRSRGIDARPRRLRATIDRSIARHRSDCQTEGVDGRARKEVDSRLLAHAGVILEIAHHSGYATRIPMRIIAGARHVLALEPVHRLAQERLF